MPKRRKRTLSRARQRSLRKRKGESAFLFDKTLSRCIGSADRSEWEQAISITGGDVALAADLCGIEGIPLGAKALWGKSADEALSNYNAWMKREQG